MTQQGFEIPLATKGLPPGHSLYFSGLGFQIWPEAPIGGALGYAMVFPTFQAHMAVSTSCRHTVVIDLMQYIT